MMIQMFKSYLKCSVIMFDLFSLIQSYFSLFSIGALIQRISPNSPAALSGLRKYDIITEINGIVIETAIQAEIILDNCKPGQMARIKITRGEKSTTTEYIISPDDLFRILEEKKRKLIPYLVKPPLE